MNCRYSDDQIKQEVQNRDGIKMEEKKGKFRQTEIGNVLADWDIKKIGDLCCINELSLNKGYQWEEIEYIDISSVDKGKILGTQTLNLSEAPSRAKRIVRDNDIIISTVRPNLKHFAFITKAKPNTVVSTGFAVITAEKVIPRFLYYYLTTDRYTDYLSAIADTHTSAYPSFNPDVIENSYIPFPQPDEQHAIAKVLRDLDSRIELNHHMNKKLEAIGQAIFKRWFIDFEFPNEEGKPYRSSGGQMVDGIPKGWGVGSILEHADLLSGGTPKTSIPEYWDGDIAWVSAKDVTNSQASFITETERTVSRLGIDNSNAKVLPKNTTVITARGTVGSYCILGRDMSINQTNYGLRAKSGEDFYVFFAIGNMIRFMKQHSYGTIFSTITTRTFNELMVPIPPRKLISQFNNTVKPMMERMLHNIEECNTLTAIRDSLLPKLMSGKIRVPVEVL